MLIRVFEGQHIEAEPGQARDYAVGHAVLVEQPGRLLQVLAAGHAEAEMIQAHPIRVETVAGCAIGRSPIIRLPRIMTTPPNRTRNTSSAAGSPGGGDSTATWKPSRLV